MRKAVYTGGLLVLVALLVAAPVSAHALPRGGASIRAYRGGDVIVFSSNIDGDYEIYTMDAAGANIRQLTFNSADDIRPVWSPDGTRIAFHSDLDGDSEIYVMNSDGSGIRQLTFNAAADAHPDWSPDGARIAYQGSVDGDREIYVMNSDGSGTRQLTHNSVQEWFPAWSPDGARIAFYSNLDGDLDIYVMDADGSNYFCLTNNTADDRYPDWSPDGTRIAYASTLDGDFEIFTMNSDGSDVRQLTFNTTTDWAPAWSPDGQTLAFASERDGDNEIYTMNTDGTNVRQLTFNTAKDELPDWLPWMGGGGGGWDMVSGTAYANQEFRLALNDGAAIRIPAGVLSGTATVTIERNPDKTASLPSFGADTLVLSDFYSFEIEGANLFGAVELTMPYNPNLIPVGSSGELVVAFPARGGWTFTPVQPTGSMVTVSTTNPGDPIVAWQFATGNVPVYMGEMYGGSGEYVIAAEPDLEVPCTQLQADTIHYTPLEPYLLMQQPGPTNINPLNYQVYQLSAEGPGFGTVWVIRALDLAATCPNLYTPNIPQPYIYSGTWTVTRRVSGTVGNCVWERAIGDEFTQSQDIQAGQDGGSLTVTDYYDPPVVYTVTGGDLLIYAQYSGTFYNLFAQGDILVTEITFDTPTHYTAESSYGFTAESGVCNGYLTFTEEGSAVVE
ncbi:MAG: PD40 domain-containing protein [Anaerolineae bacterium]|nr:PD40 domain-containing protein [Anaerolineae bacterium]